MDRFILDPEERWKDYSSPTGLICTYPRAADQLVHAFVPGNVVRVYRRLMPDERLVQADAVINVTTGTTFTVPLRPGPADAGAGHTLSMTEMVQRERFAPSSTIR